MAICYCGALFDLIRNGIAHQYQQIIVKLKNRKKFFIYLTGANHRMHLNPVKQARHTNHLAYCIDQDGDIGLKVYPNQLFLDFEGALQQTRLLTKQLKLKYLRRPMGNTRGRGKKKAKKSSTTLVCDLRNRVLPKVAALGLIRVSNYSYSK